MGYNNFNGKLLSYHCCLTLNSRKENYNCEQLKQNNLSDTKAQIFDHKSLSLFMPYGESPTLPHLPRHTHTHTAHPFLYLLITAMTDSKTFFFFRCNSQVPITDPAQLAEHLFLQHETFEKLSFPGGIDEMFGVEPSVS